MGRLERRTGILRHKRTLQRRVLRALGSLHRVEAYVSARRVSRARSRECLAGHEIDPELRYRRLADSGLCEQLAVDHSRVVAWLEAELFIE
jgi:hypothetical protein